MSILALFVAVLLFPMHACNATRHSFSFVSYTKDAEKAKVHEMGIKDIPIYGIKETSSGGKTTILPATLDGNQMITMEMQGLAGKGRSMVESTSHETKEKKTAHANEDVVVTDYVHPHRKSPIHNNH